MLHGIASVAMTEVAAATAAILADQTWRFVILVTTDPTEAAC